MTGKFAGDKPSIIYPAMGQANWALAVLVFAYAFSFIDRQILSILVEPIKEDLKISDFKMSLLQGVTFSIFYVAASVPISRLADRYDRKLIIIPGIALWSLMTIMCGLTRSFFTLFLARIGVAVGESALTPATFSMLADYYPPRLLARATSVFTLGVTVGSGLAYIIGGSVVEIVSSAGPLSLPLLGELKGWQIAFLVVGLPGFLIAFMAVFIREPARIGDDRTDDNAQVPLSEVLGHIRENRRAYYGIFGAVAFLSIFGFAYLSWYPTFLIRTYDMPIGSVGLSFGLIYIVFGTAGTMCSAFLSEYIARRGYADANFRTVFLVSCCLIPMSFGPLASSQTLALILAAPTVFLLSAFYGVAVAGLNLITPNRMRAVVTAIFIFFNTVLGVTAGATLVATLTDFVFKDPQALQYSLVIVTMAAAPIASVFAWFPLQKRENFMGAAL